MANSKRKCKYCKEYTDSFIVLPGGVFCDREHAIAFAQANIEKGREKLQKERRKETRKAKEELKTKSDWTKEAQKEFNRFIRLRDTGSACISCGRSTGAKVNAGHYRSVGGHPELRFNENNCHLQCEHCNTYLSGNLTNYRINLIEKIGIEAVESLEGPHDPAKYTIDDLKAIKKEYAAKAKELAKQLEHTPAGH